MFSGLALTAAWSKTFYCKPSDLCGVKFKMYRFIFVRFICLHLNKKITFFRDITCNSIMVLDIDQFRPEKGGNPDKIKENQKKRFCDEGERHRG